MQILLPYIMVALTVLITAFHHSTLKSRYGDAKGTWLYFLVFFSLLAVVPTLIVVLVENDPLQVLSDLGVGLGNYRIGVALMLVGLPITVLIGHFVSKTPELRSWYPFSKEVCAKDSTFVAYELGYLLLYYSAWEFLYRGVLFFPLLSSFGFLPALAITTALSTLHHIGHPKSEILGALLAGIVFSCIALLTRSLLYPIVIHAMVGLSSDTFIYLRIHRGKSAG
jgi:membrane protease YdiL (CAAX protease family)